MPGDGGGGSDHGRDPGQDRQRGQRVRDSSGHAVGPVDTRCHEAARPAATASSMNASTSGAGSPALVTATSSDPGAPATGR
jgi:hypothetical protein